MSLKPIEAQYTTGYNLHVVRHNPDGTVWSVDNQQWEAYNSANWASYCAALTEQAGSGYYRLANNIPDLDVLTTDAMYQRINSLPTLPSQPNGDVLLGLGQSQGMDAFTIGGSKMAADNIGISGAGMFPGAVVADGGNSATQVKTDLAETVTNLFNGRVIVFITGTYKGASGVIKAYNGSTKIMTFTALAGIPSTNDQFIVA